jgi:hypothetical protein
MEDKIAVATNSTTDLTTSKRRRRKHFVPPKPRKDFPLTPHPTGYWVRKINHGLHRFGRWGRIEKGKMVRLPGDGWEDTKRLHDEQIDDLNAGRKPKIENLEQLDGGCGGGDGKTMADMCNAFRTKQTRKFELGKIGVRTIEGNKTICDLLIQHFGPHRRLDDLRPRELENLYFCMAKRWGATRLGNSIAGVKSIFNYAYEIELLAAPIRCLGTRSTIFAPPSKAEERKAKESTPVKMLTPEQCRLLIDAAPVHLRAMLYLALNAGFGAADCATLPLRAVNLDDAIIKYSRHKTYVKRRCPLWPETVQARRAAIAARPTPKAPVSEPMDATAPKPVDATGLVFVTTRWRGSAKVLRIRSHKRCGR